MSPKRMQQKPLQPQTTKKRMGSLPPGKDAVVSTVKLNGLLHRRLLDLGFIENAHVEATLRSPMGDPVVYCVRGSKVALRKKDADMVYLKSASAKVVQEPVTGGLQRGNEEHHTTSDHFSLQRDRETGAAGRPEYLITLAGNPNTGKSTVFNALTGLRQHVGNWPGKTVTRTEGRCRYQDTTFTLVDLPGTYSLVSHSIEEEIAHDFIVFGQPDCTVVVVDGTCLERNLNLVLQILQITDRVVVCVNLLDEARRKGIAVDLTTLGKHLGVPVVGTEARNAIGLNTLKDTIFKVASGIATTHPLQLAYDAPLERAVKDLATLVKKTLPHTPNPRWIALRLIDGGDRRLMEAVKAGLLAYRSEAVSKSLSDK